MKKQREFVFFTVDDSWYEEYWLQPKPITPSIWSRLRLQIVEYRNWARRWAGVRGAVTTTRDLESTKRPGWLDHYKAAHFDRV